LSGPRARSSLPFFLSKGEDCEKFLRQLRACGCCAWSCVEVDLRLEADQFRTEGLSLHTYINWCSNLTGAFRSTCLNAIARPGNCGRIVRLRWNESVVVCLPGTAEWLTKFRSRRLASQPSVPSNLVFVRFASPTSKQERKPIRILS
jgi:hypothetical protein